MVWGHGCGQMDRYNITIFIKIQSRVYWWRDGTKEATCPSLLAALINVILLFFLFKSVSLHIWDAFCQKCPPWKLVSDGGLEYCHLSSTIWNQCSWGGKYISQVSNKQLKIHKRYPEIKVKGRDNSTWKVSLWVTTQWATNYQSSVMFWQLKLFVLSPRLTDFFWCSESAFVSSTIWNRLQWRTDLIIPWRGFCN